LPLIKYTECFFSHSIGASYLEPMVEYTILGVEISYKKR